MVDLSQYLTAAEIEELYTTHEDLNSKQDVLISGTNIKTINGESIVGSGDIVIEGETLTESDITAMGFTKNTGTYSKPSGGIPKTDLASDIQTSLGKADTALQSHQDISGKADKSSLATVATSGSYNDLTNKPFESVNLADYVHCITSDGNFDVPTVDSSGYIKHVKGIEYDYEKVGLSTSGISFITEFGDDDWEIHNTGDGTKFLSDDGTYKEVATKDELSQKQDVISDIDTIRSNAANYKGTVTSVKVDNVSKTPSSGVVDLGYVNKKLTTSTSSSMTLSPNIYYRNTNTSLSTLTITLGSVSNSNIINEYFVEFTTSSAGTTVSLPSTIKWANGETPTFEASTTYQISIVNNLGVVTKFK